MRLLFWLNRTTPLGHFGLQEESGAVTFAYYLLASDPALLAAEPIAETFGVVGHSLVNGGALIAPVEAGALTCEDVLIASAAQPRGSMALDGNARGGDLAASIQSLTEHHSDALLDDRFWQADLTGVQAPKYRAEHIAPQVAHPVNDPVA